MAYRRCPAGRPVAAGLDGSGRLAWPLPKLGFDLGGVAIERLHVEDGRAVLGDGASDARLALEKLDFKGELRSLAGPIKGEGSFVIAGRHYPYRLSAGRIGEDGGMKVRLAVDPIDHPLTAEAEATIWVDHAKPRFEGSIQFGRSVGRAPAGAQALIVDSWRVSARVKGDSSAAAFEQIEFQYGPDDRAIKLRGSAKLTLGQRQRSRGVLVATDRRRPRAGASGGAPTRWRPSGRWPGVTIASRLPIPATLSIGVETSPWRRRIARVGLDVNRRRRPRRQKPGCVRGRQVRLSGRLGTTRRAGQGSARVEAADPERSLLGWASVATTIRNRRSVAARRHRRRQRRRCRSRLNLGSS
jgi:hypothetical protein